MIATRLVNMIETDSEKLAESLKNHLEKLDLRDLRRLSPHELKQRAFEIYHDLSNWLLDCPEEEIAKRYQQIGERAAAQGAAMSTLIYALQATKEHLWNYIRREGLVDQHFELCQELELLQRIELFFDRATYHAARGYERSRTARAA